MNLEEETELEAILKVRDLFRQTMAMFPVMFVKSTSSSNKHIRQKFKREVKKQQTVGE